MWRWLLGDWSWAVERCLSSVAAAGPSSVGFAGSSGTLRPAAPGWEGREQIRRRMEQGGCFACMGLSVQPSTRFINAAHVTQLLC